eukprot:GDKJ01059117.1.p1 GENE.GDKJ01059117.1~~GDKJ01059117.1.p1  ORF type:complete len:123 (-),score=14.49 GDKJ01059117.1:55-423(-)
MSLAISQKFIPGRPPDKGSFPLDHDGECKDVQLEYMKCLKANAHDNMSCRYLSKEYMKCRMEKGLMENQPLEQLGFKTGHDDGPKPAREYKRFDGRHMEGYVSPIVDAAPKKSFLNFFFGSE